MDPQEAFSIVRGMIDAGHVHPQEAEALQVVLDLASVPAPRGRLYGHEETILAYAQLLADARTLVGMYPNRYRALELAVSRCLKGGES